MLKAVDFVSKAVFEALVPGSDLAVVSIGNPAEMPPARLAGYNRVLRLEFLDLDPQSAHWRDAGHEFPPEALFSPAQALELFEFLRGLDEDDNRWRLAVHCHAGISRSAAVAAIAAAMTQCDFPREADAHYANRHVVRTTQAMLGFRVPVPGYPQPGVLHEYLPSTLQI